MEKERPDFPDFQELTKNEYVLEEISYEGDKSPDFDEVLKNKKCLYARQKSFTEITTTDVLVSEWQVPCHVILTRNNEGECQAVHVQPNTLSASLLSFEQKQELKKSGQQHASAIAARGRRAWFGQGDEKELEQFGLKHERTIEVDTYQWWRLLYDPQTNEIWIDVKDKKLLTKYKGF